MRTPLDAINSSVFSALNRYVRPLVKAGVGSPLPVGPGLVVLETTGRKTGKTREVPLLAFRLGDRVAVSTGRSTSQWIRNLEADESPAVWVAGQRRDASADVQLGGALNVATLKTR